MDRITVVLLARNSKLDHARWIGFQEAINSALHFWNQEDREEPTFVEARLVSLPLSQRQDACWIADLVDEEALDDLQASLDRVATLHRQVITIVTGGCSYVGRES